MTSVASLTIHDAPRMDRRGRKRVAQWLRDCAAGLEKDGQQYAKRFTAKYLKAK